MDVTFDLFTFHLLLDAERRRRGMKWKDVASKTGVPPSSLTRLGQGKPLTIHALAKLSWWSGLSLDYFLVKESRRLPHGSFIEQQKQIGRDCIMAQNPELFYER